MTSIDKDALIRLIQGAVEDGDDCKRLMEMVEPKTGDLIKREDAERYFGEFLLLNRFADFKKANIEKLVGKLCERIPSAEPKQGAWLVTDAWPHNVYCSECYKTFAQRDWAIWLDGSLPRNFCPNCGADMRKGADDETD